MRVPVVGAGDEEADEAERTDETGGEDEEEEEEEKESAMVRPGRRRTVVRTKPAVGTACEPTAEPAAAAPPAPRVKVAV
jgi:hypothetical protein